LSIAIKEMKAAYDDAMSRLITDIQKINVGIGVTHDFGARCLQVYVLPIGITINADVILNGGPNDVSSFKQMGPHCRR
jgi:hypothetical protein